MFQNVGSKIDTKIQLPLYHYLLHHAAFYGHVEIIRILLEYGVDVNALDEVSESLFVCYINFLTIRHSSHHSAKQVHFITQPIVDMSKLLNFSYDMVLINTFISILLISR